MLIVWYIIKAEQKLTKMIASYYHRVLCNQKHRDNKYRKGGMVKHDDLKR